MRRVEKDRPGGFATGRGAELGRLGTAMPRRLDGWVQKNEKPALRWGARASTEKAGDGLLSHHLSVAVPSALQGLTAVFGMGTGVAPAR
jgi:hypothetical protein